MNEYPHILASLQLLLMSISFVISTNTKFKTLYWIHVLLFIYEPFSQLYFNARYAMYIAILILILKSKSYFLISLLVLDGAIIYNIQHSISQTLSNKNYSILYDEWHGNEFVQIIHNSKLDLRIQRHHHSVIGAMYMKYHDSAFKEFYLPDAVVLTRSKVEDANTLIIGLGIGISARSLAEYGMTVNAVEIDPLVGYTAIKWFDLPTNTIALHIEDGGTFIKSAGYYDFIIQDVFSDGVVPGELFTISYFEELKTHLTINGIFVTNFVGVLREKAFLMFSSTLKHEFNYLRCFAEDPKNNKTQNCFCFASQMAISFDHKPTKIIDNPIRDQVFSKMAENEIKLEFEDAVVDANNVAYFEYVSMMGYIDHWYAMQDMLPAELWMTTGN